MTEDRVNFKRATFDKMSYDTFKEKINPAEKEVIETDNLDSDDHALNDRRYEINNSDFIK
jgi:hypothetical protein